MGRFQLMRNLLWIILFLFSCSSSKNIQIVNQDSIREVIFPCDVYFSDSLAFRSVSNLTGKDQNILREISLDKLKLNLSNEISLFLDSLIFQYFGVDDCSRSIVDNQISKYRISCESLTMDTSDVYLYSLCVEISHYNILSEVEYKFCDIDSNYNHLEFTKFYFSKFR